MALNSALSGKVWINVALSISRAKRLALCINYLCKFRIRCMDALHNCFTVNRNCVCMSGAPICRNGHAETLKPWPILAGGHLKQSRLRPWVTHEWTPAPKMSNNKYRICISNPLLLIFYLLPCPNRLLFSIFLLLFLGLPLSLCLSGD